MPLGTPIPSPSFALNFCSGSACTGICSWGKGQMPRRDPRPILFALLLSSAHLPGPWAAACRDGGPRTVQTPLVVNWAAKLTQ